MLGLLVETGQWEEEGRGKGDSKKGKLQSIYFSPALETEEADSSHWPQARRCNALPTLSSQEAIRPLQGKAVSYGLPLTLTTWDT